MRQIILLVTTMLLLQSTAIANSTEAIRILRKTVQKLGALKSVRYHQYREVSDAEMDYFASNGGDCYFEFDAPGNKGHLTRFQLRSKGLLQVYNGTESFLLQEAGKTYEVDKPEGLEAFSNLSLLYHSMPTLRKALPAIAQDETIEKDVRDTLIAGKPYHLVRFSLQNKQIAFPQGFSDLTSDITIHYQVMIDQKTFLPYMVLLFNSKSGTYFTKTVFTRLDTKPAPPEASTWFYSSYRDYKLKTQAELEPLVALGAMLPAWILFQYTGKEPLEVRSGDMKGKVVLLEFWIRNCGYCVASFPHLKAIQAKYGQESLQVLAVNTYDKVEDVAFIHNKEKPNYKMLLDGEALARELGAVYYPTVILLDRTGKVVYVGSFDKNKVEQAIERVL